MADENINGRPTQKQIYELMINVERRITDKLQDTHDVVSDVRADLSEINERSKDNAKEIDTLRKRSTFGDGISYILAFVAALIGLDNR